MHIDYFRMAFPKYSTATEKGLWDASFGYDGFNENLKVLLQLSFAWRTIAIF